VQVIGKDILAPSHGIYYLTILKYLELKLPFKLLVHNWWLINEVKISKSLGNGLDLAYLILKYKNARLFNFFIIKEFNLNTQDVKKMITIYIQNNKDTKYIQHIRNDIPKIDDVNDNLLKSFRYNQLLSFIQINQLHFIQKIKIKYYYNIF
jgi:methionyl-tRNA synthetase